MTHAYEQAEARKKHLLLADRVARTAADLANPARPEASETAQALAESNAKLLANETQQGECSCVVAVAAVWHLWQLCGSCVCSCVAAVHAVSAAVRHLRLQLCMHRCGICVAAVWHQCGCDMQTLNTFDRPSWSTAVGGRAAGKPRTPRTAAERMEGVPAAPATVSSIPAEGRRIRSVE